MSIIPPHTQLHSLEIFYKYEFISMSIIIIPPHTQFGGILVYEDVCPARQVQYVNHSLKNPHNASILLLWSHPAFI